MSRSGASPLRDARAAFETSAGKMLDVGDLVGRVGHRLRELRGLADGTSAQEAASDRELLLRVIENLRSVEEELSAANDELRAENERLVASRYAIERELLRYRVAFERSLCPLAVTHANGVVLQVNAAFAKIVGRPHAAIVGKPIIVYVARGDCRAFRAHVARLQAGDAPPLRVHLRPRDGRPPVAVEAEATPLDGEFRREVSWSFRPCPSASASPSRDDDDAAPEG